MIKNFKIKNYKSIRDLNLEITDNIFILAGQNESGKSSILEALNFFQNREPNLDTLNFEELEQGNKLQSITLRFDLENNVDYNILTNEITKIAYQTTGFEGFVFDENAINVIKNVKTFELNLSIDFNSQMPEIKYGGDKNIESQINYIFKNVVNVSLNDKEKVDFLHNKFYQLFLEILWQFTPHFILFSDFEDILPDNINLNEFNNENSQIEGKGVVTNFEKITETNFNDIYNNSISIKNKKIKKCNEKITADFVADWNQKIDNNSSIQLSFDIENNSSGEPIVHFMLETKDGVPLPIRQRSKGLIWFFSLWLKLKASERNKPMVLLFDEPGMHLHINAHRDMLKVFNRMKENGHQIIYSTHSPSLIETEKLHNIGLVYNDNIKGTLVESITSVKFNSQNKQDALQPIAAAMGYAPSADFTVLSNKNVILEGLSDFYYFNAMAKLLELKMDFKFIPALGIIAPKVLPLISFCIGYGLEWRLVMDSGNNPQNTRTEIKDHIFGGEKTITDKYVIIADAKEVEDLFSLEDIKLVNPKLNISKANLPSDVIKNNKIIVSKSFSNLVDNNKINKNNISQKAVDNFTNLFDSIKKSFSNLD